jgi:hypothetical protein
MKRDIFQRQIFLPYWFPPIFSPNLPSQPYPPPPTKPPAPLQPTAAPLLALSLSLTRTQQLKDSPPTSTVPRISDEGAPTTHRSTAQRRSKTKPTTVFSLYGISLSLSLSLHGLPLSIFYVLFFFFFNGHSQILVVVIIFGCFFCFHFLVLEDARWVFDKMFKPNIHADSCCCDNFWFFLFTSFFGS